MKKTAAFLFSSTLLATGQIAQAAPATEAEAQQIKAAFETYVGRGGGQSSVSVTPRGEGYAVSIDVAQLARPLSALGFDLQVVPVSFIITSQSDGLWRVTQNQLPAMQLRIKDQSIKMSWDGFDFDGIYDPMLRVFLRGKTIFASSVLESVAPGFANVRKDGPTTSEITSVASGPGMVTATLRVQSQSHNQTYRITASGNDIEIGVATGAIKSDITMNGLQNAKIMELWAFLVANPSAEALGNKLEEIKDRARKMLPMFNDFVQAATVKDISITSPVGAFGLRDFDSSLKMTGFHTQGDLGVRLGLNGLSVPLALLPDWSRDLVPSDILLDLRATGFDLQATANELINIARPDVKPDESEAAGRRAVFSAFPEGKVKVTLGPSQITSKLLTIKLQGEITNTQPMPKGRLVMSARGMDETIAALQGAAGSDPTVQQVLMVLIGAKGFGKNEPDGTLTWVLENPDGGLPTINGVNIPGLGGK